MKEAGNINHSNLCVYTTWNVTKRAKVTTDEFVEQRFTKSRPEILQFGPSAIFKLEIT